MTLPISLPVGACCGVMAWDPNQWNWELGQLSGTLLQLQSALSSCSHPLRLQLFKSLGSREASNQACLQLSSMVRPLARKSRIPAAYAR